MSTENRIMSTAKRRLITVVLFAVFFCICMSAAAADAHAAGKLELESTKVEFTSGSCENEWIFSTNDSVDIVQAVSSDEKIATVTFHPGYIVIYAEGEGQATITVTGENGETVDVAVTVTRAYFEKELKDKFWLENYWYGTKKLYVSCFPGAKGTIKISKNTYKFKTNKKGECTIKLKKVYKLGTKIKVTVTHNGYTAKRSFSFFKGTDFDDVKAKKHSVRMYCGNLHKGDVVKVIYKGKTYKKKIKKNYDGKNHKVTIKVKKTLKKNSKMTIKIVNKDKKSLVNQKIKLYKWRFYQPDEDEE